ncbi:MAG: sterol desaturase family protein [Caulobacterales bacterium]
MDAVETALAWSSVRFADAAKALWAAYAALALPFALFAAVGLIVRGRGALTVARRAWPASRTTLVLIAANLALAGPIVALAASAINWAAAAAPGRLIAPEFWAGLPLWASAACALVIGDFVGYWRHRLEHSAPLWPSHAIHHSDATMTWLTLERFHPINIATTYAIDTAALAALGFPLEVIIINGLVRHWYGYWIHADLPWTYGPLGRVFVSPAMHRWHHAGDPSAYGTNFATLLSIWDQMFSTYRVPGPCTAPLGVEGLSHAGPGGQLLHPLRPSSYRTFTRAASVEPSAQG